MHTLFCANKYHIDSSLYFKLTTVKLFIMESQGTRTVITFRQVVLVHTLVSSKGEKNIAQYIPHIFIIKITGQKFMLHHHTTQIIGTCGTVVG
jgi:hypothetical protein